MPVAARPCIVGSDKDNPNGIYQALNGRLALKLGYLMRHANDPVPGFMKTDSTATASVVLRWRSAENARQ